MNGDTIDLSSGDEDEDGCGRGSCDVGGGGVIPGSAAIPLACDEAGPQGCSADIGDAVASDGGKGPAGMSGGSLSGMPRSKPGDRGWPLGEGVKNRNSDSEEEDGVDHKTRDRRKRDREYSIQMRMVDECADGWRRVVGENKRLKEEVSLLRERVRVLEG